MVLLISLAVSTMYMTYRALDIQLTYGAIKLIPPDHPIYKQYIKFKANFGDDGNIMVLGLQSDRIFKLKSFNNWYRLGNDIKKIEGIEGVVSIAHLSNLVKNNETKGFDIVPLVTDEVQTHKEMDSLGKPALC